MTFDALISELDNKGKVLRTHEHNNFTAPYKTKTYTAHDDATMVQAEITTFINIPGQDEIKIGPEKKTNPLYDDAETDITFRIDFNL